MFVLRRWFLKVNRTADRIIIKKGICLTAYTTINLCDIVRVTVRQPPLLRLFHAKEIEIFCVKGSVKFYANNSELALIFSEKLHHKEDNAHVTAAKFREVANCALCKTHALGGVLVFSAVLIKASRLFSGELAEQILKAISQTSQSVYERLYELNLDIPKTLVTAAVFVILSWGFAYVRNLLKFMRFSSKVEGGFVLIKHGILTLYEHRITLNSIAITEDTPLTLISGYSHVKMRGVTVHPALKCSHNQQLFRPMSFWGYCKIPVISCFVCGILLCVSYTKQSALSQLLILGICLSLYKVAVSTLYKRYSGITLESGFVCVSSQRMQRLCSAIIPEDEITQVAITRFLRNKRCNVTIHTAQNQRFKIRQI